MLERKKSRNTLGSCLTSTVKTISRYFCALSRKHQCSPLLPRPTLQICCVTEDWKLQEQTRLRDFQKFIKQRAGTKTSSEHFLGFYRRLVKLFPLRLLLIILEEEMKKKIPSSYHTLLPPCSPLPPLTNR